MKEHYLYKYVYNNEIIYIGKTNSSLKNRIDGHKKEEKFQPYIKGSKIYIMELSNSTEVNTLESLLINKYSPMLNVINNHETVTSFQIEEPMWEEYIENDFGLYTKNRIKKIAEENKKLQIEINNLKTKCKKILDDNLVLKTENKCLHQKMYQILERDRSLESIFLGWVINVEDDIEKYKNYIKEEESKEKPKKSEINNYEKIIQRNELWLWQLKKLTYVNPFIDLMNLLHEKSNDETFVERIKKIQNAINKKYEFYPNGKIHIIL